jgi:hypothetical protein
MKFIRAIARSEKSTQGIEMQLPVQGNEAIWDLLATRILQLLETIKRYRLHSLIAVDHHSQKSTVLRGGNHWLFPIQEVTIDVSNSGHITMLLQGNEGRLHWPSMSAADVQAMKSAGHQTRCHWCAGEASESTEGEVPTCPVCHQASESLRFDDIELRATFRLPDGSQWQKITPTDALCVSDPVQSRGGQSSLMAPDHPVLRA